MRAEKDMTPHDGYHMLHIMYMFLRKWITYHSKASLKETNKALNEVNALVSTMNIKVSALPSPEGIDSYVSWPALTNALKGLQTDVTSQMERDREEFGELEPSEFNEEVDGAGSDLSIASVHPTSEELEHLKNLGSLIEKHENLSSTVSKIHDDILIQLQEMIFRLDEELKKRVEELDTVGKLAQFLEDNKADKDTVMMEIMEKADLVQLDTKVDKGLFETVKHELSELIQDVGERLMNTDENIQRKLEEIFNNLDHKLNSVDIQPLREYMEKRFKAIGVKISKLEPMKEDSAAGIKKQLLHFHCLSCDRPLEMTPHSPTPSLPAYAPVMSTRSLRPYTTYELEQIRQFQKTGVEGVDYTQARQAGGKYSVISQPPPRNRPDGESPMIQIEKSVEKLPNIPQAEKSLDKLPKTMTGSTIMSLGSVGRKSSVKSESSLKQSSSGVPQQVSPQNVTTTSDHNVAPPIPEPLVVDKVEVLNEEEKEIYSINEAKLSDPQTQIIPGI